MKLDISKAVQRREEDEEFVGCDALDIATDTVECTGDVRVVYRLSQDGDTIRVEGETEAPARLVCDRCLEPYDTTLTGEFSLVMQRLAEGETFPDAGADEGEELDEDDIVALAHDQTTIDITDIVRDAVLLSLPVKSLCSGTCRGLCDTCGANLNVEECSCEKDAADSRWDALKNLFDDTRE